MSTKTPQASPLVPKVDIYIKHNLNILLIGPHGVGKTEDLWAAAARHGKKLKYFSCSTMDPFTELVGIPYPAPDMSDLHMVRPHQVDEADIIFFDELNRAPDMKTLDAILEVVQFHTINGEPLKVSAVWASINPVDKDKTYNVKALDPALVDRFDVYEHIQPKISMSYFNSKYDSVVSMAIRDWFKEHTKGGKADYISPRRLDKIAGVVTTTRDLSLVGKMMPPDGKYDHAKLAQMLGEAIGLVAPEGSHLGGGSDGQLFYDKGWLKANSDSIVKQFKKQPPNQETASKILATISTGVGHLSLVDDYGDIIECLPVPLVEAWFLQFKPSKRSNIRGALRDARNKYPNFNRAADI